MILYENMTPIEHVVLHSSYMRFFSPDVRM